jgi:glycyl-tRNA synthetase beta chain
MRVDGTPRRLVVLVQKVAAKQNDSDEEIQGPAVSVAYGADGAATPALEGFLRKNNAKASDVVRIDSKKGPIVALRKRHAGQPTSAVLPALLEQLLPKIPFKKTMRWGDKHNTQGAVFGRPVQWLLALLHGAPLSFRFADVVAGNTTRAHRYHAPDAVVVKNVAHYLDVLERGQVMLSRAARKAHIEQQAQTLARSVGGTLLPDVGLLELVKNLVEKPFPILGHFDEKFLSVPKELLVSEAREHQKYFMIGDGNGGLKPAFVVVAGAAAADQHALAGGNARVLRARFEDGAFYYQRDTQQSLASRTAELERLVYQRELGTMAQKQTRIVRVSTWLALQCAPQSVDAVGACARLCKNDLVTGVVNEFPELQGVMGRYYAVRDGEPADVASGIEEHYAPRVAGGPLPSGITGALVGIADRVDSIVGLLGVGKLPSGSADPFALRRAAASVAQVMIEHRLTVPLSDVVKQAIEAHRAQGLLLTAEQGKLLTQVLDFVRTRVKTVLQERAGSSDALAEAAMSARGGFDNVVDAHARVVALTQLRDRDAAGFQQLAATMKRVCNVVAQARDKGIQVQLNAPANTHPQGDAERRLVAAVGALPPSTKSYGDLLDAVVALKPLVDAFFDEAMVMVDDTAVRDARLSLLAKVEDRLVRLASFDRLLAELQSVHKAAA